MIAQAEYNRSWLENDMDTFKKNLTNWSKNNTNPTSPWYSKPMPEKPYIKTFDDNLKYDRSKNDSDKRMSELIDLSLYNTSESLKLCKNNKEKANAYYFLGWVKFLKNNVFKIARIAKKITDENIQEDFEKAIELDPENHLYYRSLADSYFNTQGEITKEGEKIGLQKIVNLYQKSLFLNSKQPLVIWRLFRFYSSGDVNLDNQSEENNKYSKMSEKYYKDNGLLYLYRYLSLSKTDKISTANQLEIVSSLLKTDKSYDVNYTPEFQGYLNQSLSQMFNCSVKYNFMSDFNKSLNMINQIEIDTKKKIDLMIKFVMHMLDTSFSNLKTYSLMSQMLPTGLTIVRSEVYKKISGEDQQKIIDEIISIQKEITRRREVKLTSVYFTSFP